MSPTQLSEIKRVAEAASTGSWYSNQYGMVISSPHGHVVSNSVRLCDGNFIATMSPETTKSLLATLEASQARVEELELAIIKARQAGHIYTVDTILRDALTPPTTEQEEGR